MLGVYRKGKRRVGSFVEEGKQLCPHAVGEQSKLLASAIKRKITALMDEPPHHSGKVTTGIHSNLQGLVKVQDEHASKWACKCYQEIGMQCEHALSLIYKAMVTNNKKGFVILLDPRLLLFVLDCHLTPQGIVDLNTLHKNRPCSIFHSGFYPDPWCSAIDDWTHKDNEPHLAFAEAEMGFMVWLCDLRLSHPRHF